VLFVYGIAVSEGAQSGPMLTGGVIGLLGGIAVGIALYLGLLRVPARHLFAVTGWMILLLAAGMASQGTAFLVQAGMLPALGETVWDTSRLISQRSIGGQLLHALIGYADRPDGIQVLAYTVTALTIGSLMLLLGPARRPRRPGRGAAAVALGILAVAAGGSPARADFTVHVPLVVRGEREVEAAYTRTRDPQAPLDNQQVYNLALGYGVTNWWLTELEGEWEKPPKADTELSEMAWENTFQLTEPGEYRLNLGVFAEYAWPQHSAERPNVKVGPILQLQYETALHTVNLFFERQVGPGAETAVEFTYAWQSRFRVTQSLDAGFEIFGAPGEAGKPLPLSEQELRAGPVLYGTFKPSAGTRFRYQVGYLVGQTKATPDGTWKANIELEFY
jgi:hypothetical protein